MKWLFNLCMVSKGQILKFWKVSVFQFLINYYNLTIIKIENFNNFKNVLKTKKVSTLMGT